MRKKNLLSNSVSGWWIAGCESGLSLERSQSGSRYFKNFYLDPKAQKITFRIRNAGFFRKEGEKKKEEIKSKAFYYISLTWLRDLLLPNQEVAVCYLVWHFFLHFFYRLFQWYSFKMVAKNMLRTYGAKWVFSEKKTRIWQLFPCNQMPPTNRNTWYTPYVRTVFLATI